MLNKRLWVRAGYKFINAIAYIHNNINGLTFELFLFSIIIVDNNARW